MRCRERFSMTSTRGRVVDHCTDTKNGVKTRFRCRRVAIIFPDRGHQFFPRIFCDITENSDLIQMELFRQAWKTKQQAVSAIDIIPSRVFHESVIHFISIIAQRKFKCFKQSSAITSLQENKWSLALRLRLRSTRLPWGSQLCYCD